MADAFWTGQLPGDDRILTSPAVGADGSVYVVGLHRRPVVRDHGANVHDHRARVTARLYRFLPGGQLEGNLTTEFPIYPRGSADYARGPLAPESVGQPKMWQLGSDEAVIVPALYPTAGGTDLHVFAISPAGGIMADWVQHQQAGPVVEAGGLFDFLFPGFTPGVFSPIAFPSLSGVAIADIEGAAPYIVLTDRWNSTTVVLALCIGSSCPTPGFAEAGRSNHAPRKLLSSPAILPDAHSAVGTDAGVVFGGPNAGARGPMDGLSQETGGLQFIHATPTTAADGRTIVVTSGGETVGFTDSVLSRIALDGWTIAGAANSRTHVFVATTTGLHTLDATGSAQEATHPWTGGGVWSPVVGPQGHVYTMADHTLLVFAPPRRVPARTSRTAST